MNNKVDTYIRNGYDLTIGMVDRGMYEGWFKAELEHPEQPFIQVFGETPGEAFEKLKEALILKF